MDLCEFESSLAYKMSSRTAKAVARETLSQCVCVGGRGALNFKVKN